jgi:hypothetical protein
MKLINCVLCTVLFFACSTPLLAQKYKAPADTVKLNEEYIKVKNNIIDLNAQLSVAQNNLPGYQSKAATADVKAQSAASTNSGNAAMATDGNIRDVKEEKKSADHAYDKAKDARSANNNVGKQNEKIKKITEQLRKKQQRLNDLDVMRNAIYAQLPANTHQ